jgi:bifunctional DNase/RNase
MVPVQIKGFFIDREQMPIAVLCDEEGQRVLPIWIGPSEANSIIVRLEQIKTPGPLAHDLLASTFLRHGFHMDRLEIYDYSEAQGYIARIRYHRGFRRYELDVRPSDGLAVAVRLQAPVYAHEELLATSSASELMASLSDPSPGLFFLHAPRKATRIGGAAPCP